jgi:hypothetical protein
MDQLARALADLTRFQMEQHKAREEERQQVLEDQRRQEHEEHQRAMHEGQLDEMVGREDQWNI